MSAPVASLPSQSYSTRYRRWMLGLLILAYASSFVDRIIVATVGQAMKVDLQLSDLQLGLLGGMAFALFYTVMGIPVARLAERFSRVRIICAAVAVWSAMTALCGVASSYTQLLLFRMGVGIGEAGGTPASHSLIADHYPPHQRATAYGLFSLGVPLGVLVGALGAGWIVQHWGWRWAFIIIGLPGLLLALVMALTLREPPRGMSEPQAQDHSQPAPSFSFVLAQLMRLMTFRHAAWAMALGAFGTFGINLFLPIYFSRVFGMSYAQAGLLFGLMSGGAALAGNVIGGYGADWAGRRDQRWYLWLPAAGFLLATPFFMWGVLQADWRWAVPIMGMSSILLYISHPPTFAVVHSFVAPRSRATATALVLLLLNLVGQGLGPLFMGWASDWHGARAFAALVPGEQSYAAACRAAPVAQAAWQQACGSAAAQGVRYAIVSCACIFVLAGLHYALAARALGRERTQAIQPST